jgi:hypothetical protein
MSDAVATYLQDHLAGANFGIEVVKTLESEHKNDALGQMASGLLVELEEDRRVLQSIIDRLGAGPALLKEAAAWVGEKVSELKLRRSITGHLGTFEALEALGVGILGKRALWRALPVIAEADSRLREVNVQGLVERAESQHARVEERRLEAARTAFVKPEG